MTRRRKKCRCCRELFHPRPQTYRQQIVCDKSECQAWRIRRKWEDWSRHHPVRGSHYQEQQITWRQSHPNYNREWRKEHPASVRKNREEQRRRNREKRSVIAKPTAWKRVRREELSRIRVLRLIAKPTECTGVEGLVIDGILRHLEWVEKIAKPTDMDLSLKRVQNASHETRKRGGGR